MKLIHNGCEISNNDLIGIKRTPELGGAKGFLQRVAEDQYIAIFNNEIDNQRDCFIYKSKKEAVHKLGFAYAVKFYTQNDLFIWLACNLDSMRKFEEMLAGEREEGIQGGTILIVDHLNNIEHEK